MVRRAWVLMTPIAAVLLGAAPARGQTPTPPVEAAIGVPAVSVLLPNYNTVPIGEVAGLEAGAFVARANDTSAGFYNTAGLARAEQSSISGGAGVFEFGSVTPEGFTNDKSTFQQIPAMFGFVVRNLGGRDNLAGGFSLTRVHAWNQVVETESVRTDTPANRFRFSTDASFGSWIASAGVASERSPRLRLGASIDGQYTWSSRQQLVADQLVTPGGLAAAAISTNGSASLFHLRTTLAGQYEVTPAVHVGVTVRTPGLAVFARSSSSAEGIATSGPVSATASFFDPEMPAEYKLPFEIRGGVAWLGDRAQVEVDLFTYTGRGAYVFAESSVPVTLIEDAGQGGAPTVVQRDFASPVVDSRAVVNVAAGGQYALTANGAWMLHGGVATDRSPVGDRDTAFTRIDLHKVTVGLSARTKMFLGSVGLQYLWGRSDSVTLGQSPIGSVFATRFAVSSLGLVYSFALQF